MSDKLFAVKEKKGALQQGEYGGSKKAVKIAMPK
jgi:hypothetical protein